MTNSFDSIWEELYASGKQCNRYPFDSVVSFIFRNRPRDIDISKVELLDIGCGSGNHLWFAAREGMRVCGIDASKSAIDFAQKRLSQEGLTADLSCGDFTQLPYNNNRFDMAIDRLSIGHVSKENAQKAIDEVRRSLKSGGLFYCEIFSDQATYIGEVGDDGLVKSEQGIYQDYGQIAFYGKAEIQQIFNDWKIESLIHCAECENATAPFSTRATWRITSRKPE